MFAFMSRRMSAASEAMVLAVLLTLSTAALGTFAITEPGTGDGNGSMPRQQVLVGTLTMEATDPQSDGTHWAAALKTGDRTVPVRISHEDFHRTELQDAPVQVQGSWSADGSFVAALIEPVDPTEERALDPLLEVFQLLSRGIRATLLDHLRQGSNLRVDVALQRLQVRLRAIPESVRR
jgi:hypothetical protein